MKPLYSLESEKVVINHFIEAGTFCDRILKFLLPVHFYDKTNRWVYEQVLEYYEARKKCDVTMILTRAQDTGNYGADQMYFSSLVGLVGHAGKHATNVYEKYMLRELARVGKEIIEQTNQLTDSTEISSFVDTQIKKITGKVMSDDVNFYDSLESVFKDIKDRLHSEREFNIKSEYFPSLNKYTGGFRTKELVAITAKDKQGKTTFALSLLLDFALNSKVATGVFSLEMDKKILNWKALSLQCDVDYNKLRNPKGYRDQPETQLTEYELEQLALDAHRSFVGTKIFFSDDIMNERQIRNKIKYWKDTYDVKFIVIDYIGLIPITGKFDSREREVAHLSRFFKLVAKELDVIILMISQQNRDGGLAESLGLYRDCDFAFSIRKPYDEGVESIKIDKTNYPITETDFVIKYERNRHGVQSKQFTASYIGNIFRETDLTRIR